MSNQSPADKSTPVTVESHLAKLVDGWSRQLTPADFKIAASLYRAIERNGGRPVCLSARQVAEAAGVSERKVESARKTLAAKGVIRLEMIRQSSWYGFPEAPDARPPECPESETAAQGAPAPAADGDNRPASSAGLDIHAQVTPPALSAEAVIPAAPASGPPETAPGPAIDTPANAGTATAEGAAKTAEPDVEPELIAALRQDRHSADTGPALSAEAQVAIPAQGSAKTAEPAVGPELSAEAAGKPSETPAPASLEDQLAAWVRQLTNIPPDAKYLQYLQDLVPDHQLLLDCLHWMRARRQTFENLNIFSSAVRYHCLPSAEQVPSQFLDDRRAQRLAEEKLRRPK